MHLSLVKKTRKILTHFSPVSHFYTPWKSQKTVNVTLKRLRHSHLNNVIFSYGNIDILCIAKTKLDERFPNNQFVYQYNQSKILSGITENKGCLMEFIKSHRTSKSLNNFKIPSNMQIIPFEINLRNEKWLVASICKAPSQKNKYFLWY